MAKTAKTAAKRPPNRKPPTEKKAKPTAPGHADRIVRGMLRDFERNLPPDAAGGMYGGASNDRFANRRYIVPNGTYVVAGSAWAITFKNERFVQAVRSEHKDAWPARPIKVAGPTKAEETEDAKNA